MFFIVCRKSSFASSNPPSILMFNEVRTRANNVGLNSTVPSSLSGMSIATSRLQAILGGQSRPNPRGGLIFLSRVR